jgi:hypothetical protein
VAKDGQLRQAGGKHRQRKLASSTCNRENSHEHSAATQRLEHGLAVTQPVTSWKAEQATVRTSSGGGKSAAGTWVGAAFRFGAVTLLLHMADGLRAQESWDELLVDSSLASQ